MATEVYTFKVTYDGFENKIWRTVEVSSRYPLDKLGYCILATFDALTYHLFSFSFRQMKFYIPTEWDGPASNRIDMASVRMEQLKMQVGDVLEMEYDFGVRQTFHMELTSVAPMKRRAGTHYPYITAGEGLGILDDLSSDELSELIDQISHTGKTDEEIYYHDRVAPWDYRHYSLDTDNAPLKGRIEQIEDGYLPFWTGA